jgi:hypothetical protein
MQEMEEKKDTIANCPVHDQVEQERASKNGKKR